MGIPPTGRHITVTEIAIARFANGKIVELWFNADDLGGLQQLGVIPALFGVVLFAGIAGGIGLTFLVRKVLKS